LLLRLSGDECGRDGTQRNVLDLMQTRADLYKYLDYHAYEAKLDELFARGKEK
jgi:methylisocitrate lyase